MGTRPDVHPGGRRRSHDVVPRQAGRGLRFTRSRGGTSARRRNFIRWPRRGFRRPPRSGFPGLFRGDLTAGWHPTAVSGRRGEVKGRCNAEWIGKRGFSRLPDAPRGCRPAGTRRRCRPGRRLPAGRHRVPPAVCRCGFRSRFARVGSRFGPPGDRSRGGVSRRAGPSLPRGSPRIPGAGPSPRRAPGNIV